MADEGNEDSWLYGKADGGGDGEGGPGEDQRESDGAAGKKNGSAEQSAAEDGGSPGRKKRPRSSFSDEEHQQHDDNAMDSSDLVPAEDEGDGQREEEEFHGEEDSHLQEEGGKRSDGEMDSDDSDDDDDINVVIRPTGPSYNIIKPRGPIIPPQAAPAAPGQDKSKQPAGKFSIDEFESVGTINGVPAHEFSIDSLDEKPWRKPGSDITDYFNYGFNEETWRAYCERQKRMRMHESGVGLQGLTINNPQAAQAPNNWRGPPPPRKMNNGIDVIGGMNMHQRPEGDMMPRHPKENVIQVMTADRREYSRSAAKFDSMGAPFGGPQDFYPHESDYGDYGYEPTQADQWNQESQWQPHGIKTLTPGPPMMQGMGGMPPPHMMPPPMSMGPPGMGHHGMRSHDRDRDRDRDRSRRSRDHDREHRRDRDRDRDRGDRESVSVKVEGESSRSSRSDKSEDKEKRSSSKSDRHKDRYRERSRSREKSKSRRRSRSRDRERHGGGSSSGGGGGGSSSSSRSEKKKSHRKDKEEDE